jgi:hypothetical protein
MGLIGFVDLAAERRKVKSVSFKQVNTIVDWRTISNIINKQYVKSANTRYRGLPKPTPNTSRKSSHTISNDGQGYLCRDERNNMTTKAKKDTIASKIPKIITKSS